MTAAHKLERHNQPRHDSCRELRLLSARVMRRDGRSLIVAVDDGPGPCRELSARPAASCLLAPEVGDSVLVALGCRRGDRANPEAFVLAVLERDGSVRAEVAFDGDARIRASCDELGVVSRIVDRVAERISERAERVYRFVGELDQLRARHFDYRADETARIKGDNTMVTARQVAKVDGEQVHIG